MLVSVVCFLCISEDQTSLSQNMLPLPSTKCYLDSGVMIPTPKYSIYSTLINLLGEHKVGYFLDENSNWKLRMKELEQSLTEACNSDGNIVNIFSFILINHGTPMGAMLSKEAVHDVLRFFFDHNLGLIANKIY